jgi:hypothetical protein
LLQTKTPRTFQELKSTSSGSLFLLTLNGWMNDWYKYLLFIAQSNLKEVAGCCRILLHLSASH